MSFTMDSGIELMSEHSTMDGSFQTDTWEYMKVREERGKKGLKGWRSGGHPERQKKPARERTNVEDWKIRGRREVTQRTNEIVGSEKDGQNEGDRISVEVELHNLKLDDLKKMERRKEGGIAETVLKDTIYMIESPGGQDSSSGIASDDHGAPSTGVPGSNSFSTFSNSFLDSELSDDHAGAPHVGAAAGAMVAAPGVGGGVRKQNGGGGGGGSLSSQQGSNRGGLSSDPESFTQDESDTNQGQGYGYNSNSGSHGYTTRHHDNKPRSRVPLSPKVTVKDSSSEEGATRTSQQTYHQGYSQQGQSHLQGYSQQGQGHLQGYSQHHHQPLYHISEEAQPMTSYIPHQNSSHPHKQSRARVQRNSYVNVHLNGYAHLAASQALQPSAHLLPHPHHQELDYGPETGYSIYSQNGYDTQQDGLPGYDSMYPSYPYKGYTLEETERLIQQAKRKNKLSYFDFLPNDVIIRILGNLSSPDICRCARVSRKWYDLAWEPALWTSIRLSDPGLDVDRALKQLTKRLSYDTPTACVMVEKIYLNGCEQLSDKGLNTIARRCPELRQLECQGCPNVTNIALFEVFSRCVNLEHLNVAGCPCINCICLTPEATVQATAFGKDVLLRYLDMSDCFALDDAGLQIIASYCSQLVHLYLRRCSRVTDIGVQYVANYCTQLREFSISDCKRVTDFGMRELSKLEGNLRYLSVAKCDQVSDVGIKYIARYCHKLRYLNVRGCEGVSDDSIEMVARNCKRLKSLDIGKCDVTDDVLQAIATHCPQLRKLSVKSCDAITDAGIIAVANSCRQLQQLNIQDCQISVDAYRIVKKSCKRCIIEHTNPGFY